MYCIQCGRPLPDGRRFCTACGAPAAVPSAAPAARKSRAVPALLLLTAVLAALLVYGLCTWQPRDTTEDPAVSAETDAMVRKAIHYIKTRWRQEYSRLGPEYSDGYLEIRNTRVITVAPNGLEFWSDITCVVEFQLFTDYLGSAPYYLNAGTDNTVTFYADGNCQVGNNPFLAYASRTFSYDFYWIDSIQDLGAAYNDSWYLL